ncbi:unnamed protein product [Cochlearia groenlandica]
MEDMTSAEEATAYNSDQSTTTMMMLSENKQKEPKILPDLGNLKCPRCDSHNTKFCYFNNYSLSQPRHFCKSCRRYWTRGGALRKIPIGDGESRKNPKRICCRDELCVGELGAAQLGVGEQGAAQLGVGEQGAAELGVGEQGAAELGVGEQGTDELANN